MAKKDFYKVLGVSKDATAAQIKSAYRKLARKYHPDVSKDPDSQAKFTEATEAYEVISDTDKRKMYDRFGHAGPGVGPGPGQAWGWSGQDAGPGGADFFGGQRVGGSAFMGMGLDEILEALRGRRSTQRKRPPARGADTESPLTLEFLQAARGMTVTLNIQRPDARGKLSRETIEVKIPAGVKDGSRVRIKGKGGQGPGGAGDLYIVTHLRKHPYFGRQNNDIYIEVPISITESALGAKVDVPTIDGMMTVKIPPATRSGQKLRLKGKGIARSGSKRGDQYVVIRVEPPAQLSKQAEELLKEFDVVQPYDPREDAPWQELK